MPATNHRPPLCDDELKDDNSHVLWRAGGQVECAVSEARGNSAIGTTSERGALNEAKRKLSEKGCQNYL